MLNPFLEFNKENFPPLLFPSAKTLKGVQLEEILLKRKKNGAKNKISNASESKKLKIKGPRRMLDRSIINFRLLG